MNTQTDPSGLWGSVVTVLGAVLAAAVAFGVDLTETEREAILGVAVAVGPLVTALLIRRHAWAPRSVDAVVGSAYARGSLEQALPAPVTILHEVREDPDLRGI